MPFYFSNLILQFAITITVTLIITNSNNFIFSFLDNLGLTNDVFQKSALSALVALVIGLVKLVWIYITHSVIKKFEPFQITLSFFQGENKLESPLTFTPDSGEYEEQELELKISFEPKGKLNIFIMKFIGIVVDVYFNPKIVDIYFKNGWESKDPSFEITERCIKINLLGQLDIRGKNFLNRKHVLSESILIKPVRIHNSETYLDYGFSSCRHGAVSKLLTKKIELEYESLEIMCKGVR